jgi:hypothetical protein
MTVSAILLSTVMCAITWFNPDESVYVEGELVWPEDIVYDVAKSLHTEVPNLTYIVTCPKQ